MSAIKIIFFDIDGTLVDPATGRPVSVAVRKRLATNGWDEDLA